MSDEQTDEWKPETLKEVLWGQLARLEKQRTRLHRKGKTADDDPELLAV